jgi:hypothetical protein
MSTVVLSERPDSLAGGVLRALDGHRWFIALVVVYAFCGVMAVNLYDLHERMSLSLYSLVNLQLMAGFAGAWLICYPLYVMVVRRPERLVRHMIDDFRVNVLTVDRVVGALVVFTGFKTMIGVVNPFAWDAAFAAWDRWLHFGRHPWEILHPVLAFPWVTSAINIVYNFWLVVLYLVLFWQAFTTRDLRLRMQFLWITSMRPTRSASYGPSRCRMACGRRTSPGPTISAGASPPCPVFTSPPPCSSPSWLGGSTAAWESLSPSMPR